MTSDTAPSSTDSEMAVLSSIFNNNDAIHEAMALVNADDFFSPKCKRVFKVMTTLMKNDKAIDMLSVCDVLRNNEMLDDVGVGWLSEVEEHVPTATSILFHCSKLKASHIQRKFIDKMQSHITEAHRITDDPSAMLEDAYGSVFSLMNEMGDGGGDKDVYSPKDLAELSFTDVKARFENPDGFKGLQSGIDGLDECIKSFKDVNVIAASTGVGKTALALNIALNLALKKVPVLYINLEMDINSIMYRVLANLSGIPVDQIETGRYEDPNSLAIIADIASRLENSGLYMTHNKSKNINKIVSLINKYKAKFGIKLVIIDYIGHIDGDKLSMKENNRRITLGRYNQILKRTCVANDMKAIIVAQMNRDGDKEADLTNIGECWQLAQDADIFLIYYFEMIKNSDAEHNPDAPKEFPQYYIKVAKNRNGRAPFTVPVNYNKDTQTITEGKPDGLCKGGSEDIRLKGMSTLEAISAEHAGESS